MTALIRCSCHRLASTIAPTSTYSTQPSNAPSQTSSPPSKIHFRPRKIRKLSLVQSLSCNGEVDIALRHLHGADPLLVPLIDVRQLPTFDLDPHGADLLLELNHRTPTPPDRNKRDRDTKMKMREILIFFNNFLYLELPKYPQKLAQRARFHPKIDEN